MVFGVSTLLGFSPLRWWWSWFRMARECQLIYTYSYKELSRNLGPLYGLAGGWADWTFFQPPIWSPIRAQVKVWTKRNFVLIASNRPKHFGTKTFYWGVSKFEEHEYYMNALSFPRLNSSISYIVETFNVLAPIIVKDQVLSVSIPIAKNNK